MPPERKQETIAVLTLIAEENYAHARDHEQLRAQVTSMLVGAAFVSISVAIDKAWNDSRLLYVAIAVILIGLLNVVVVVVHNNRFDRHVSVARIARTQISSVAIDSPIPKLLSLAALWVIVASLPIIAGCALLFMKFCTSAAAA